MKTDYPYMTWHESVGLPEPLSERVSVEAINDWAQWRYPIRLAPAKMRGRRLDHVYHRMPKRPLLWGRARWDEIEARNLKRSLAKRLGAKIRAARARMEEALNASLWL